MAYALAGPSQFVGSAQSFLQNFSSLLHSIRPSAVTSTGAKQSSLTVATPVQRFAPAVADALFALPASIPKPIHLQNGAHIHGRSFHAPTASSVLLAAPLRSTRSVPQRRAYSTRPSFSPFPYPLRVAASATPAEGSRLGQIQQTRALTLWPKAKPTLPPVILSKIARAEAEANTNPDDVGKQVALFRELVSSGGKSGAENVVTRWERMCQFVRKGAAIRVSIS
ncbi:hypothetical protein CALCODRAFT_365036 [Calocera cornea HHB12733]|uniref:Uncharacterized protein n=1 Tax=Calocera cornea HHB12733 TaxID=1353952 RepID=A0A165J973_9BASI|nr:hypothetical protein CALCODRAFT_365036 [Calocera cornea HHB12733]